MLDVERLAAAMEAVFENPPGWQVLGSTAPLRAKTAFHHAATAIAAEYGGVLSRRRSRHEDAVTRAAFGGPGDWGPDGNLPERTLHERIEPEPVSREPRT